MNHTDNNGPFGIMISLVLALYSVVMNWFEFIGRADKLVMEPVLHFTQWVAALMAITGVLYTISPRFKRWLNKIMENQEPGV